jgi:hypothetical protein
VKVAVIVVLPTPATVKVDPEIEMTEVFDEE